MTLRQYVLANQSVQVNVHVLKHEINIPIVFRFDNLLEPDDVWMAQLH